MKGCCQCPLSKIRRPASCHNALHDPVLPEEFPCCSWMWTTHSLIRRFGFYDPVHHHLLVLLIVVKHLAISVFFPLPSGHEVRILSSQLCSVKANERAGWGPWRLLSLSERHCYTQGSAIRKPRGDVIRGSISMWYHPATRRLYFRLFSCYYLVSFFFLAELETMNEKQLNVS